MCMFELNISAYIYIYIYIYIMCVCVAGNSHRKKVTEKSQFGLGKKGHRKKSHNINLWWTVIKSQEKSHNFG